MLKNNKNILLIVLSLLICTMPAIGDDIGPRLGFGIRSGIPLEFPYGLFALPGLDLSFSFGDYRIDSVITPIYLSAGSYFDAYQEDANYLIYSLFLNKIVQQKTDSRDYLGLGISGIYYVEKSNNRIVFPAFKVGREWGLHCGFNSYIEFGFPIVAVGGLKWYL